VGEKICYRLILVSFILSARGTSTNQDGFFEIPYQASDFIIDGKESGGADIILRFYRKDKLWQETAPYRNADSTLSVKVVLKK
jgi:hypothetical protein